MACWSSLISEIQVHLKNSSQKISKKTPAHPFDADWLPDATCWTWMPRPFSNDCRESSFNLLLHSVASQEVPIAFFFFFVVTRGSPPQPMRAPFLEPLCVYPSRLPRTTHQWPPILLCDEEGAVTHGLCRHHRHPSKYGTFPSSTLAQIS